MLNDHTKLVTTLNKEVECFDAKNKKYKLLITVEFEDYDPIQFSYSLLDQWIKKTIDRKAIFPEEVAKMVYEKMYVLTKEEGHDCSYTVTTTTVKHAENLNVKVSMTHTPGQQNKLWDSNVYPIFLHKYEIRIFLDFTQAFAK